MIPVLMLALLVALPAAACAVVALRRGSGGSRAVIVSPAAASVRPAVTGLRALPCDFHLGSVLGSEQPFVLPEEMLQTHMCVLGRTGSGKSKFLELWMRQMIVAGRGFTLIDPNGDLSEDVLAFVAYLKANGDDRTWRKVHYIEPSFEMVFGYDPFTFRPAEPVPPAYREAAYQAWLHTKVDRVIEVLQRKQGQASVEGFPRLQRVLTDVLTAVGTAVDDHGRHLPLADSLVLLDLWHPRHGDVYGRVLPFLPSEIAADFRRWHDMRGRPDAVLRDTESTINRLRSFLSPLVKAIFCEQVHTIDFRTIIEEGGILLVNLRETDYFSADQARAIGGLFIHEILTTAASALRHRRTRHALIIDEAPDFVGMDLARSLRQCRKYLLAPVVLAGQDVSSFQRGEIDIVDTVLSQPGVLVTFEQRLPADLEILGDIIFRGNLSFEELYQVHDRPDGHDFLTMEEYSENFTWAATWGESLARSRTHSASATRTNAVSAQENWSKTRTRGRTWGSGEVQSANESETEGRSHSQSPMVKDYWVKEMIDLAGTSAAVGRGRGSARSTQTGGSETEGDSAGGGRGWSRANANGTSAAAGLTHGDNRGDSRGGGLSVSYKTVLVPRTREEWHPTGKLRHAIADQREWYRQRIHALRGRQAAVKLPGVQEGLFVEIGTVTDKWAPAQKYEVIGRMVHRLHALHPYYHPPQVGNAAQERRLVAYLGGDAAIAPESHEDTGPSGPPADETVVPPSAREEENPLA